MENRNELKATADKIVLSLESDPKKIAEYINAHAEDDIALLTELYIRASTLSGKFLS